MQCLLGCDTAWSDISSLPFWRNILPSSSGQKSKLSKHYSAHCFLARLVLLPLRWGQYVPLKTLVNFYQTIQCHPRRQCNILHSHCYENLKPHTWRMTGKIQIKACHSIWVCQIIQIVNEQKDVLRCVTTDLKANVPDVWEN
jgi:hypothetical protein